MVFIPKFPLTGSVGLRVINEVHHTNKGSICIHTLHTAKGNADLSELQSSTISAGLYFPHKDNPSVFHFWLPQNGFCHYNDDKVNNLHPQAMRCRSLSTAAMRQRVAGREQIQTFFKLSLQNENVVNKGNWENVRCQQMWTWVVDGKEEGACSCHQSHSCTSKKLLCVDIQHSKAIFIYKR